MQLGQFSVSLTVKNLKVSRAFYEQLGFSVIGGSEEENYLILRSENNEAVVGLFYGMFERNILTFNPLDVRSVQKTLKGNGISFEEDLDEGTSPASFVLTDPDGNPILFDQHYDTPSEE
ncbi:MAG: VOC family protein [Phototrophicaceae bacterium]